MSSIKNNKYYLTAMNEEKKNTSQEPEVQNF